MGSLLQILGNHEIEFNSGHQTIKQFEERLGNKVKDGNYHSDEVQVKVDDFSKIQYFVSFDHLETNFTRWNEVKLLTNYKYCTELSLFNKVIKFSTGCKYSYWKNILFQNEIPEDRISQHNFCKEYWINVNRFASELTKTLGGERLILFDDSTFQEEEDLYHQGKSLDELIVAISKKWEPTAYKEILKRQKEFKVKNGWYIQSVK